tara:strand:+ start:2102 stop:2218 length:117 start_codon:yes stop_codon:yes gene_type:complete
MKINKIIQQILKISNIGILPQNKKITKKREPLVAKEQF